MRPEHMRPQGPDSTRLSHKPTYSFTPTPPIRTSRAAPCPFVDVEKAGAENISTLIETGESIIADERQAWQSTANRLAMTTRGKMEAASAHSLPAAEEGGKLAADVEHSRGEPSRGVGRMYSGMV